LLFSAEVAQRVECFLHVGHFPLAGS
jgi:hypothetical protein